MSDWTDKKIEKLKKLWERGHSAAEIGKKIGFSKNAVVGKVHRLGLSNRNSPIRPASGKTASAAKSAPQNSAGKAGYAPKIEAAKQVKAEPPALRPLVQKTDSSAPRIVSKMKKPPVGVSMLELTSDLCCWPIDDVNSENFHFCGKKVFRNKPYCLEHCAIAYTNSSTPSEEREADEGVPRLEGVLEE